MANYAFSGGVTEIKGAGQRSKVRFNGTWAAGDSWTLSAVAQLSGDFTLGKGRIAGKTLTCVFKLRNRVLLGFNGGFAISAIDDPVGWEEQNVGAAAFPFSTQYGLEDSVYAFSVLGDKLVVFGAKTIQIWNIDADPSKWTLFSVLDNTGTQHNLGAQAIGELDVLYPDRTGVRSLQSKELSGDAYTSDIGTPVDVLIRAKLVLAVANNYPVCSVVEPSTKQYWVFIYDTIFVYSSSMVSKISAWSTFKPSTLPSVSLISGVSSITGLTAGASYYWDPGAGATSLTNGTETIYKAATFTAQGTSVTIAGASGASTLYLHTSFRPIRMFAVDGLVYLIGSNGRLYSYDNTLFDWSKATVETPWLDDKQSTSMKQFLSVDIAATGSWRIKAATNPRTNNPQLVAQLDPLTSPTSLNSSSFDLRRYAMSGVGTRIKLKIECSDMGGASGTVQPRLSQLVINYNQANQK